MSIKNNKNILVGSVVNALDKRLIIGDSFSKESLQILILLVKYVEYCTKQYQAGVSFYESYIKTLNNKIDTLKYKCPDICIYKDKLIIRLANTPPTIENNSITIPFSFEDIDLSFTDVVYNYQDINNDYISEVVILSVDEDSTLSINTFEVIVNEEYSMNTSFTLKYKEDITKKYLLKNTISEPCLANIIETDYTEYQQALVEGVLLGVDINTSKAIFQKISGITQSIPNSSIIYAHIDTTSMALADRNTIADSLIAWYDNFKIENPTFVGSLLINTKNNEDIDDDFAPGRGGGGLDPIDDIAKDGVAKIQASNLKNYEDEENSNAPQELWLQNPTEGLLRQAWKEGISSFTDELEFFNYIANKSLIVLSFVDESNYEYHATTTSITFANEPTSKYVSDYNNFVDKVRAKLSLFKGTLYPITKILGNYTKSQKRISDAFLQHSIGAIEGRNLSGLEIDNLLGQKKYAAYDEKEEFFIENTFYPPLANNVYVQYPRLKELGWIGEFTKVASESGDNFDPVEFSVELDELLSTEEVIVEVFENYEIDVTVLGTSVDTDFSLKVKDNNVIPLFSNTATITVTHEGSCEALLDSTISTIEIPEDEYTYTITSEDLKIDSLTDKITVNNLSGVNGTLYYKGLPIYNSLLPIVILREDIDTDKLYYTVDNTELEDYSISIEYGKGLLESVNYSLDSTLILTKEGTNIILPSIYIQPLSPEIPIGEISMDILINATVSYIGTGTISLSWEQVSGTPVNMLNPTEEDLNLTEVVEGTYEFKLTAVESIAGLPASETVTIEVISLASEDFILFGGNITELTDISSESEVSDVLDVLQQQVYIADSSAQITCQDYNDFENDWGNYSYIAFKDSIGTLSSILQDTINYEVIGGFSNLGVFTYNTEVYRLWRTNSEGALSSGSVLTLTFI